MLNLHNFAHLKYSLLHVQQTHFKLRFKKMFTPLVICSSIRQMLSDQIGLSNLIAINSKAACEVTLHGETQEEAHLSWEET